MHLVVDSLLTVGLLVLPQDAGEAQQGAGTARERALAADARNDTKAALAALDAGLKASPNDAGLLAAKGRIDWRLLRTASAEQALIAASKNPAYAAEAQVLARTHLLPSKAGRPRTRFPAGTKKSPIAHAR